MKRAQLTLFVIIGIMLVSAVVGTFFLLRSSSSDTYFAQSEVKDKVDLIRIALSECVDSSSKEALLELGLQGGYSSAPEYSFSYSPVFFPYYYYHGDVSFPSLDQVSTHLEELINTEFVSCIDNVSIAGLDVSYTVPISHVNIDPDLVRVSVDLPVRVSVESASTVIEMSDFDVAYNVSLLGMLEVAQFIAESHATDPSYYCASCVASMARERGIEVYVLSDITGDSLDNSTITGFVLSDPYNTVNPSFQFVFFTAYTGEEVSPLFEAISEDI